MPSAKPIGFVKQDESLYTLMERVKGYTWTSRDKEILKQQGLTDQDEEPIKRQIEEKMHELRNKYEEFGIYRKWKHSDMVFDLDLEHKKIISITPVDWEKSHLDLQKMKNKTGQEDKTIIKEILSLKT